MKTVSVPVDFSILLEPSEVALYLIDDTDPSYTVSLRHLVSEWIDSVTLDKGIYSDHTEDAYELINELEVCILLIKEALHKESTDTRDFD